MHSKMQTGQLQRTLSLLLVLLVFMAWTGSSCEAAHIKANRVRRQVGRGALFCPRPNGQFQNPANCSQYIQCDAGRASLQSCQRNLVFNPARSVCDWPANVPFCQLPEGPITGSPSQSINYNICNQAPNGGDRVNGYQVPHPNICNAFFTCSRNYLYAPCTFCPQNMHFSLADRSCRSNDDANVNTECGGREYVPHNQKVYRQLDGSCRSGPIPGQGFYGQGQGYNPGRQGGYFPGQQGVYNPGPNYQGPGYYPRNFNYQGVGK